MYMYYYTLFAYLLPQFTLSRSSNGLPFRTVAAERSSIEQHSANKKKTKKNEQTNKRNVHVG